VLEWLARARIMDAENAGRELTSAPHRITLVAAMHWRAQPRRQSNTARRFLSAEYCVRKKEHA
jgi:hypothetical protein